MGFFFTIFYQPIYNLLVLLATILPGNDLGWSIIGLTVIIKAALFPLTFKTMKAQREMKELQPKINAIKEQYKDEKEKMAQELMAIYKEHKVNPLGSCLPILVQIPIFIAIFQVLRGDLSAVHADVIYGFIPATDVMHTQFLGAIDLAAISIPLAILAAGLQYYQVRTSLPIKPAAEVKKSSGALDEDMAATMQRFTLYFIPAMTLIVGSTTLPAGVMIYWITTTIVTIALNKKFLPKDSPMPVGM